MSLDLHDTYVEFLRHGLAAWLCPYHVPAIALLHFLTKTIQTAMLQNALLQCHLRPHGPAYKALLGDYPALNANVFPHHLGPTANAHLTLAPEHRVFENQIALAPSQ